jgi:hypothetical protein
MGPMTGRARSGAGVAGRRARGKTGAGESPVCSLVRLRGPGAGPYGVSACLWASSELFGVGSGCGFGRHPLGFIGFG